VIERLGVTAGRHDYSKQPYLYRLEYLTRDELFAVAAVFTLLAWGFAFENKPRRD
jgi:hypothetical protein